MKKGTTHARSKVAAPKLGTASVAKREAGHTHKHTLQESGQTSSKRSIRHYRPQGQPRISLDNLSAIRQSRSSLSTGTTTFAIPSVHKAVASVIDDPVAVLVGFLFVLFGTSIICIVAGWKVGAIFLVAYIAGRLS